MKIDADELMAVVAVVKKRFTNFTAEETLRLSSDIMRAIELVRSGQTKVNCA